MVQGMRRWHRPQSLPHIPPASWLRLRDGTLMGLDGAEDRGVGLHWSEGKNVHSSDMITHP